MAEKHKSKYKAPKDLEKSQKPKPRKDLKDYTVEDKDEKMNPYSTGEKQKNVLRKTDKEVIDNGSQVPDIKDTDRAYKLDGDHDPKHAAKIMSKRQEDEEKEISKDDIKSLTREQKERFIREFVRRRIKNILKEQSSISTDLKRVTASLTQAIEDAKRISAEEGVTQHVNHIGKGQFDVSNWFDSDNTVASFENGREINESLTEQEVAEPEAEEPITDVPAEEPATDVPVEEPATDVPAEEPAPDAATPEAEPEVVPSEEPSPADTFINNLREKSAPEQVSEIFKIVRDLATFTGTDNKKKINDKQLKKTYMLIKRTVDRLIMN